MIRITSGQFRGRQLKVPEGLRPTAEIVRKAVFDILGEAVRGSDFLDAAAGSGAVGLEALSRGAGSVTFVEAAPRSSRVIRQNAQALGVLAQCTVLEGTVEACLARGSLKGFDLVYFDPPYDADADPVVFGLRSLLRPSGTLVVERRKDAGEGLSSLGPVKARTYGSTQIFFFERPGEERQNLSPFLLH